MNSSALPLVAKSLRAAAAASVATLFLAGCASVKLKRNTAQVTPPSFASVFTPETVDDLPPLDPTLLQRPNLEYRLGPGDVIEAEIIGDPLSRSRSVVGPDGKIYFHMLPGVDVWGLTLNQTRETLVKEMQKFVREEQPISVRLRTGESQRIWVLGRLNKPGVYSMAAPMTLLEAVSLAGGPSPASQFAMRGGGTMSMASSSGRGDEAADLRRSFVIRNGKMLRVDFQRLLHQGDMSQNIYLQPDDFVYLPSATTGSVHVLGAVNTPRAVEFTSRMTLVQAVAQAGGVQAREAYPSQVAIVRGSLTEPQIAVVDMTAIVRGAASDIVLEPQDIVYIPHSPYRVLTRLVDTVLNTFVRVVGVNEGARAVGGGGSLGVNVPLGGL